MQFDREVVDLDVLAAFTNAMRGDFPGIQRQPILPPVKESFDVPNLMPSFEIKIDSSVSLPRTWFISPDTSRLVQVQSDRLSLNWRRVSEVSDYPRYKALRQEFRRHLKTLRECAAERTGAPVRINMCEVTYVNPITPLGAPQGGGHPPLSGILNRLRPRPRDAFLPPAEDAEFQTRWRIPGSEVGGGTNPAGRLYLTASPGFMPQDPAPIYIVTLLGRVVPLNESEQAGRKALDIAHKWVVLGFEDLTTAKMQAQWGRREIN